MQQRLPSAPLTCGAPRVYKGTKRRILVQSDVAGRARAAQVRAVSASEQRGLHMTSSTTRKHMTLGAALMVSFLLALPPSFVMGNPAQIAVHLKIRMML